MDRAQLLDEHNETTIKLMNYLFIRSQHMRKYGTEDLIYMAEADTISIIGNNPNINASDIAHKLGITKSAVSKTVNRLLHKGLITKTPSLDDTRKLLLNLTPKGKTIYEHHKRIDDNSAEFISRALSNCTNEEIMAYIKIARIHIEVFYEQVGVNGK